MKHKYQEHIGTNHIVDARGNVVAIVYDDAIRDDICTALNKEPQPEKEDYSHLEPVQNWMNRYHLSIDDVEEILFNNHKKKGQDESDARKIYSEIETHRIFIDEFLKKYEDLKKPKT